MGKHPRSFIEPDPHAGLPPLKRPRKTVYKSSLQKRIREKKRRDEFNHAMQLLSDVVFQSDYCHSSKQETNTNIKTNSELVQKAMEIMIKLKQTRSQQKDTITKLKNFLATEKTQVHRLAACSSTKHQHRTNKLQQQQHSMPSTRGNDITIVSSSPTIFEKRNNNFIDNEMLLTAQQQRQIEEISSLARSENLRSLTPLLLSELSHIKSARTTAEPTTVSPADINFLLASAANSSQPRISSHPSSISRDSLNTEPANESLTINQLLMNAVATQQQQQQSLKKISSNYIFPPMSCLSSSSSPSMMPLSSSLSSSSLSTSQQDFQRHLNDSILQILL